MMNKITKDALVSLVAMNRSNEDTPQPRTLEAILNDQVENMMRCGRSLDQLFLHLSEPAQYITQVKQIEEAGDKLTAEAYHFLEFVSYSEVSHLTEQFVKHLDDVIDGMNNTARSIDICKPKTIQSAAQELLATVLSMVARLRAEIAEFPANDLASVKLCREMLKGSEEEADAIYHEWRKLQRRLNSLPLIDESNWTEILGILEQTTDSCYHASLVLERMTKCRLREQGTT